MKWTTTDCYGNPKTWYSEDVILKIKLACECINLDSFNLSKVILDFLNEVDK